MPKTVEILRDNLLEHPAAQAWRATEPERIVPKAIAVLKKWTRHQKSGVYRLAGVGPGGSAVVAKRCPLRTAAVEQPIYEAFLPQLPLPTLGYFGSVEDPDGQSRWLFMEDASGDLYSPQNREHCALAARWLAAIHNASRGNDWKTRLPDRGPDWYLQLLRSFRAKVREHLANPDLSREGALVFQTVIEQCDVLEAHWREIGQICDQVPRTLVHGDFVVKNLRVRNSAAGSALLVFDWEFACWGVPGADLAQHTGDMASPDFAVYLACQESPPMIKDETQAQRLAACGKFFRLLDEMAWTSMSLRFGRPESLINPVNNLRAYGERMAFALSDVGWTVHD